MSQSLVPSSLRKQLGDEAALDLSVWIDAHEQPWGDRVLQAAADRFGRVLAEELGKLRAEVHKEITTAKFEILKWSFLFWLGQIAVITGLLSWMLGDIAPR
ncbi:MAG: hypothetical protein GEV06_28965 [Luteitalea sp.]|nr:hypothetical protein [Luteitalea sp.]